MGEPSAKCKGRLKIWNNWAMIGGSLSIFALIVLFVSNIVWAVNWLPNGDDVNSLAFCTRMQDGKQVFDKDKCAAAYQAGYLSRGISSPPNQGAQVSEDYAQWGIGLGFVVAAVLAFILRSRFRVLYGIIEILVGIGGAWLALGRLGNLSMWIVHNDQVLQLLAAFYVMVRGMDSIENGLKDGGNTCWHGKWRYVFYWDTKPSAPDC